MTDLEKIKQELEDIQKELQTLKDGSRAYKAFAEEQTRLEAQLADVFVPLSLRRFSPPNHEEGCRFASSIE